MKGLTRQLRFAAAGLAALLLVGNGQLLAQLPQPLTGKDPLIGVWKLNVEKSRYERGGPSVPAPAANPLLVWTYNQEKDGALRMSVYAKGLEAPVTRSFVFKWDGKEYPDPQGPDRHESVIYWRMDPKMLTRLVLVYKSDEDRAAHRNPVRQEWVSWSLSEDGKTLAINAWSPATPEYTNRQIFDRVSDQPPTATR
jgi:hypothetical protein